MFLQFFAAARNNNQWYRYLTTLVGIVIFALILFIPVFMIAYFHGTEDTSKNLMASDLGVSQPVFLGLEMIPNIALTIGVVAGAWLLHKRPWRTLITAYPNVRWERYFFGCGLWLALMIGAELLFYLLQPDNYVLQFDLGQFFGLLFISILVIPIQAAGEELIFRGYLMQGIGWASKRAWLALIITSIGFGLMHLANPEMEKYGQGFIVTYIITGCFFGFVTLMDEGSELAMGAHAINNIYGAVLVTFPSSALELPAVFKIKEYHAWGAFAVGVICFIIFLWICAKKYGWTDWQKITRTMVE
jgi:uncharacterized protein